MQKQIAVLSQKEKNITLSLKKYFENKNVDVYTTDSPLKAMDSDLCIVDEFYGHISNNILEESIFIKLHNSLLPAFDCENPIEKAFKAGVKVSGITTGSLRLGRSASDGRRCHVCPCLFCRHAPHLRGISCRVVRGIVSSL